MTNYNKVNNIIGWVVFIIATGSYWLTSEPTCSFWDCGEFTSAAWKLQLSHSPGAPLFTMLGHLFMRSANDPAHAAVMFNHMSNIMGGLTCLFLFWSITALSLKALGKKSNELSTAELIVVMGAGLVGSLATAYCDSLWFSTVEAIVFASSAAFTSFVFWAILKWEHVANTKYGDRWILLIAYVMGLSIGVHLLNLLTIPAIVFIYWFKKFPYSRWGLIKTFFAGVIITGAVQYGIIQSLPYLAASIDILFVNKLHMPFDSGSFFFLLMLISSLSFGILFSLKGSHLHYFIFVVSFILALLGANPILDLLILAAFIITFSVTRNYTLSFYVTVFAVVAGFLMNEYLSVVGFGAGYAYWYFTARERNPDPWRGQSSELLNRILLVIVFITIGYSSYTMVLIRANANPSINMSNPRDLTSLLSYLSREQYGDHPLLYGQVFTETSATADYSSGEMRYWKGPNKYEELERKPVVKYDASDKMFFPRAWDVEPEHIRFYQSAMRLQPGQKPTMLDNLGFFFNYQINWMYLRYFMWNFAGRQNDVQGRALYDAKNGNWISGISFIDNLRLGSQDNLPPSLANNKAKNKFYFLPLILGIIGIFFHFNKKKEDAFVVLLLFVFMGLAIVVYLNQYPLQPRERDYSYVGSFYAFTIWIGLGVLGVYSWIKDKMKPVMAAILASCICLVVPIIMAAQGWDDHDRSNRYTCRDFGRNYLESCAPNAILFTQGDNDTYPLWYAQEVENIRPDVRIVNLSLLGVDWYIDNLRRKVNQSDPIDFSIPDSAYRGSRLDQMRDYTFYREVLGNHPELKPYNRNMPEIDQTMSYDLKTVVDFISNSDPKYIFHIPGQPDEHYLPAKKLFLNIDKKAVIASGTVQPEDTSRIVSRIDWTMNRRSIQKPSLMIMDIIQQNHWKRPIYFAYSVSPGEFLGLGDYMQMEGLAFRLVPVKQTGDKVQANIMYNNIMKKFAWGGVDKYKLYLDENIVNMVSNLSNVFARLADALIRQGDKTRAIEVLNKCLEVMPERNVPYSGFMMGIAGEFYKAGVPEKGNKICNTLMDNYTANLKYYSTLDRDTRSSYKNEITEAAQVFYQVSEISKDNRPKDLSDKLTNLAYRLLDNYSANMKGYVALDASSMAYYQTDINDCIRFFYQVGEMGKQTKQKDLADRAASLMSQYQTYYKASKEEQQQQQQEEE